MKNLHLYLSLLFVLTCAKEDSQAPNTPPTQIVKQYALTANAGDGGSVTGGGTFASGTQVSLTATPSSGYSFSGWSNGSTTNPLTITLNSNTTITANFQVIVNSYTLTVTAGEGGSVSTEGGEYEEGTEVTISATPDEGYEFIGWEGSDSDSSSLNITMNGNESLSALFQKIYFSISYDQIFVESPSSKPLIETIRNHETDDYIISSKGWLGVEMREYHSGG
ncbi:InlB B-repeat-containing protein, partial [Flavobacteriaceae bacterium]|nr:InlB B-repeat-containing protein [Flavobacteriaceae bacterium]